MASRQAQRAAVPTPSSSIDAATPGVTVGPELVTLLCPCCGDERLTETPPCSDGHGDACPDRACIECGTALMLDAPLLDLALGENSPGRRTARRTGTRRSA